MISGILSLYRASYITALVYMLQNTEYRVRPYLAWYWRTTNFNGVMKRRALDPTRAARMLRLALAVGMSLQVITGLVCLYVWRTGDFASGLYYGVALILSYPVVWAHLVVVPLFFGRLFIVSPKERRLIRDSRRIFAGHPGVRIAVAGSYGKTSMKEILLTVIGEGKKTAATPANKNMPSTHAQFAKKLKGDEEVVIIEYGEGKPGDIKHFTDISRPNIGVITGVAPAHLDRYKTVQAAARDIFYLAEYLGDKPVYVNVESKLAEPYLTKNCVGYSAEGADGWKASDIEVSPAGIKFNLEKDGTKLRLSSGLVGKHQVGPLSAAVALAHALGVSDKDIISGVAKTKAFEHRMQPRNLHGAWLIDDTYNGNIEGIRVGLEFLSACPANRKIYVTPGLVDQGAETKAVHKELGRLIAKAKPDVVVLMSNSVTPYILEGLGDGFTGELMLEHDPLQFYTNLDVFVAAGDVVLMQNDWTDNYA